jgi:hypothetical protein
MVDLVLGCSPATGLTLRDHQLWQQHWEQQQVLTAAHGNLAEFYAARVLFDAKATALCDFRPIAQPGKIGDQIGATDNSTECECPRAT